MPGRPPQPQHLANKEWTAQIVLDYAIRNKDFFDLLVENKLLTFRLNE